MSLSQPPLPPESPIVIPPTPGSGSGAPAQGGGGGGGTPAPAGTRAGSKPPSPPRIDSGVVLEEALQQALTLGEGEEGSEAEKKLEEREQAAVARPPALSAHSSGARSVASLQSAATQYASQRPSPSSGRGSYNTAWSSRSPNSRASSGSNVHDYPSTRSSFERRSSGHNYPYPPQVGSRSQLHLHVPPGGPYQGVSSPYGYSPSQHTPSDGSAGGVQYPYGTFYPSPAFYHPYPQHQQQAQHGGEAVYPHHQYGGSSPAFIAYQPFTSPLPSPHPSSQYSPASFPFSAAGPTYSPYAPVAPGLAGPPPPSHPGLGVRRGSSDRVYDDQGNPISPVELSSPVAGGGGGETAYYYPQPQPSRQQQVSPETLASLEAQGQAGVYPPPPPPQAGNGYQPVYVFPPAPPPPLAPVITSYAASPPSAAYAALHPPPPPPPLHPPSAPPGPQHRSEQPLSYPISSARPASPARGDGSGTEPLVYPISHSTASSSTVAAPQPAEPIPPPPPPPLPYYYPQPQQPGQPYSSQPPPPPPPGGLYPSPHPSSIPYTPSASAPLPQHLQHPQPHQHPQHSPIPVTLPAQQQPAQLLSPTHSHLSNGFSASASVSHSHSHSRDSSAASISLVGATGLPLTAASTASTAGTAGTGAGGVDLPQPRVYEVPSTPARGQLAQAGLRKAAGKGSGVGAVSPVQQQQQGFSPPGAAGGGTGGRGAGRFGGMGMAMGMGMAGRRDLPRPPAHSPYALWVGNVPSDASHAELWSFFQGRPVPSAEGVVAGVGEEGLNLDETGIESIHLIARSNCAFVNYTSSLHLRHAITVSNGLSLRPSDPRCKTFLCRERKTDDDFKSGVGAQRVGGMHRSYIREQRERMAEGQRVIRQQREAQLLQQRREREREESIRSGGSGFPSASASASKEGEKGRPSPDAIAATAVEKEEGKEGALSARRQSTVSCLSVGSATTTSTFLAKHFERRYFILKSHDEADLRLSVETGLWATQAHNEPVLQQAFRTAKTVYLIFGANGQGAWFGVARMAGPISGNASSSSGGSRPSWSSRDGGSSTLSSSAGGLSGGGAGATSLSAASQTIMEDSEEPSSFPARPPLVLTDSDSRLATSSPLNMSPALPRTTGMGMGMGMGRNGGSESAPATLAPTAIGPGRVSSAAKQAMSIEADLVARETADNLHLPPEVVARRAATFDDQKMGRRVQESESALSTASGTGKMGLEKEAERRNLRLEAMEDKTEEPGTSAAPLTTAGRTGSANWGTPFAVEWITVRNLPFARTKHIRNSFNGNREIKISRDGTEVEPSAGEALLSVFWAEDPDASPSSPPSSSSSPASSRSPPGRVASGMVGGAVAVEGVEKV